jgi:hypothetical protein
MGIIKKFGVLVFGLSLLGITVFSAIPSVSAVTDSAAKKAACEGLGLGSSVGSGDCIEPTNTKGLNGTVTAAINIISLVVAVIAVIMVIVGGLKYVTSQGESAGTASAKNTIIYAIIGLIVVALAQIIVRFVANRITPTAAPTP